MYNVISPFCLNIYDMYIYLKTLSGDKSCLVVPGVTVLPGATETVLSLLVGGWWGQGITLAFTRCMMKKKVPVLK